MNDNYKTDQWVLDVFANYFDPCPLNENPEINGLNIEWKDHTFVNPPYSNPLPWIQKAITESSKGKTIVMLLKMDTSTRWFKLLQENNSKFLWINGRLKYNKGKPAPFPSMIAVV